MSYLDAILSSIVDTKGSLDIGLKFVGSVGSKLGFLSLGSTTACLKELGDTPVTNETLSILVPKDPIESKKFMKSLMGRALEGHEVGFTLATKTETSSSVTGLKEKN